MPRTLLLADDSVVIQKLVGLSFANEDIELITADNGDDAIERARETRPDLVLADVIMPGKSGYEVCEAIKQDPELQGIPVLLLTGTFEAFDEDRANSAGADGHITKPFEAQALVDRVKEMMAGAASATPAAATTAAPAPAQTTWPREDSYDFFDDDASEIAGGVGTYDAVIEGRPVEESAAIDETASLVPRDDLEAGSLGSDHTVALMPEADGIGATSIDPVRDLPTDLVDLPSSEPELEAPAIGDVAKHAGSGETFSPPILDPAATVLADDFLASPDEPLAETEPEALRVESEAEVLRPYGATLKEPSGEPEPTSNDDDFHFGAESEPIDPANVLLADDLFAEEPGPEAVSSEPIDIDPLAAAPDLDIAFGTASQPEANVQLDPAADSAFDISASDLGDRGQLAGSPPEPQTRPGLDSLTAEAGLAAAPSSQPSAPALPAAGLTGANSPLPGLDPVLRERVHETLEKIAWEAFSELSEAVVREVMQRVERIAWEVIPQTAETLVREEIERMKNSDGSED